MFEMAKAATAMIVPMSDVIVVNVMFANPPNSELLYRLVHHAIRDALRDNDGLLELLLIH